MAIRWWPSVGRGAEEPWAAVVGAQEEEEVQPHDGWRGGGWKLIVDGRISVREGETVDMMDAAKIP